MNWSSRHTDSRLPYSHCLWFRIFVNRFIINIHVWFDIIKKQTTNSFFVSKSFIVTLPTLANMTKRPFYIIFVCTKWSNLIGFWSRKIMPLSNLSWMASRGMKTYNKSSIIQLQNPQTLLQKNQGSFCYQSSPVSWKAWMCWMFWIN